ncbi:GlxA family transcriptional regulator [Xenorhabdus poinarii]|uniref:GlxA family transcriptional regulator n=1 Tax=Xenorhabdus poinarii TaxID=40577 RepID=UPI003F5153DE
MCENMLSSGLCLPIEMWKSAASRYFSEQKVLFPKENKNSSKLRKPDDLLTIRMIGVNNNPIPTYSRFNLIADTMLTDDIDYNIIYIPALWRNPRPVVKRNIAITQWLSAQSEKGTCITAVGTGCCFLADARLLDNKPATTHWHYFKQFARDYPSVHLKTEHFITKADNIFCAASVKALSDLTIHFIETFYGEQVANHTQRTFFHEIRSNVERHCYSDKNKFHPDEDIIQIQMWMKDNCMTGEPMQMQKLADIAGMSLRNFNRRFKNATDMSPLQYLLKVRIDYAIDFLQLTNLTVQEIAALVGYQDMTNFNRHFKRRAGVSPRDYRKTVRAKMFHAER